jgi:hypothetical protein
MKKTIYMASLLGLMLTASCTDFLDNSPRGVLDEEQLVTPQNVDGFVTAAYSALGNDHYDTPFLQHGLTEM